MVCLFVALFVWGKLNGICGGEYECEWDMWRCRGILEYSLDSHAESPGSNLIIAAALLSFSKAIYPHYCSRPRCINGDPVGCDRLLCLNLPAPLSQAAIPGKECSPGSEIVHCKCGIEMYPVTGVIICCKRFGPHGEKRV